MSPEAQNLSWLLRVRSAVWGSQAFLIFGGALFMGIQLPLRHLGFTILASFLANGVVQLWVRRGGRPTQNTICGMMMLDIALHAVLFSFGGGPFNPFTLFFIVNVMLSTLLLSRRRQWFMLLATALGYASLFVLPDYLAPRDELSPLVDVVKVHVRGMVMAFTLTSVLIFTFMNRVLSSLRQRERELDAARETAARNEKLAALTTLAAGAAHELATPLGTIALVARELEHALETKEAPKAWRDDAALLREQVERCRVILKQMSNRSGELPAESLSRVSLSQLLDLTLASVSDAARVKRPGPIDAVIVGPQVALSQALASLIRNGLAVAKRGVELRARTAEGDLVLEVADDGPGLTPEVIARIGEPFFTTRAPGQGMGLGVFLARTVATQLGGALDYECPPAGGTIARLTLPLAGGDSP